MPTTGTISNKVWSDTNFDGQQNGTETGVGGVQVQLFDAAGALLATATTNASGVYTFANLAPATYTVKFKAPGGYAFTKQNIGSDTTDSDVNAMGVSDPIVLAAGATVGAGAGLTKAGHIGDTIFEDLNANGIRTVATELGLAGVTVQLKDSTGAVIMTTTTDASGLYGFDVAPGTYTVHIVTPAGYALSAQTQGTNNTLDSDFSTTTGDSAPITVTAGVSNNTVDGGLYRMCSFGDLVWHDLNGNGQQDAGEPGLAGVTVNILNSAGAVVGSTVSATDGSYVVNNLKPGAYVAQFVTPAGYQVTKVNTGSDATDSDVFGSTGTAASVTLASGGVANVDAGYVKAVTIGDKVWEDTNANGIQDAGEPGVAGATVTLVNEAGATVLTRVTAANGSYSPFYVTPGTYSVVITPPTGYVLSPKGQGTDPALDSNFDPTTLSTGPRAYASGTVDTTVDAGLYKTASLGDRVWVDANANGQQDTGEAGLAGVTVKLLDAAGAVLSTQTTDASGNYLFTGIKPGSVSVQITTPAGYTLTSANLGADASDSDFDPTTGKTAAITLASGESNLTVDAGLVPPTGHIGNKFWEDTNGNGVQDATEPGLAGVALQLKDAAGTVVKTTTTAADGSYGFDVAAGAYTVTATAPAGYVATAQAQGGNAAADSDFNPATLSTGTINVTAGSINNDVDGGLYRTATLGDRVWIDTNANGQQDASELGLAGVTVNLLDATGAIAATKLTDATGAYQFTQLTPGTYSVQVATPAGYKATTANLGADASDSDIDPTTGKTAAYTLNSGDSNLTVDAGFVLVTGHIGDIVWLDANGNGVREVAETGIAGVTLQLKDAAGTVIQTTVSDANGAYGFDVAPGSYTVTVVPPAGYLPSTKGAGTSTLSDNDFDPITLSTGTINVTAGSVNNDVDGGLYRTATLGDRVWIDTNANGQQDASELGLAGVTVNLLDATGAIAATKLTDATGAYQFTQLTPGTYSVQVATPAGYKATTANLGADASDSDIDPTTGKTAAYTLNSGDSNLTVDAGFVLVTGHIGDIVWLDANGNGVREVAETGIAGVTLQLKDAAGTVIQTTVSDANGAYGFDVVPGSYTVTVVPPAGYLPSAKGAGTSTLSDSDFDPVTLSTLPIAVTAGSVNNAVDSGLFKTASIGDFVWHDLNGNGQQDAGEPGLGGVTVNILNSAGSLVATGTTAADGSYAINNLNPGVYTAQFVTPTGYQVTKVNIGSDATDSDVFGSTGTASAITLTSGAVGNVDAGYVKAVSIGDKVWLDTNGNGIQDTGELGVAGATVSLVNEAGATVLTRVTAANGSYSPFFVVPGNYSVVVTPPAGYLASPKGQGTNAALDSDIDPTTLSTGLRAYASGTVDTSVDAGLYKPASLGDHVWLDANGNGQQDTGETGIAGVTVNLLNAAGAVASSLVTDASGNYLFTNLAPGNYSVQVIRPAGYAFTGGNVGADATDSDTDSIFGITPVYTLKSGDVNLTVDSGLTLPVATGHVGNRVWDDANGDGIQDPTEVGLVGVSLQLKDAATGAVVQTGTTVTDGFYGFDVPAGNYTLSVVLPTGYAASPQAQGTDPNLDSDISTTTLTSTSFTVAAGAVNNAIDAGLYKAPTLGNFVWLDANGNGQQDAGETGVPGTQVDLLDNLLNVVATQTTDATGHYLFTNLVPGAFYSLAFTAPAGMGFTATGQGTNDTDSDALIDPNGTGNTATSFYDYYAQVGVDDLSADVGLVPTANTGAISGRQWLDVDTTGLSIFNGTFDDGVDPLAGPGQHVQVFNSSGVMVSDVPLDQNASYKVSGLPAGTYTVQFFDPIGWSTNGWTTKHVGDPTLDSDVNATGITDQITVVAGQEVTNVDAGSNFLLSPIVLDLDGNGIHTISVANSTGSFDLLGNGHPVQSGWISAGDAFLAVDTNGNGSIDSIKELFGGNHVGEGFNKLAGFDSNHDGAVDAQDTGYATLLVWRDANGDHQSQTSELMTLTQAGVTSLALNPTYQPQLDAQGNLFGERSHATTTAGTVDMIDVYFQINTTPAASTTVKGQSAAPSAQAQAVHHTVDLAGLPLATDADAAHASLFMA